VRFLIVIACSGLAALARQLGRGFTRSGFSVRLAFLLALPALGATSGACGPAVATGAGAVAVVFGRVSDFARAVRGM
jgi:hypothetical protein